MNGRKGVRIRKEIKIGGKENQRKRGREQSSRERDPARLSRNRGYLRLISKESCQVSADNVLMETRQ